MYTCLLDSQKHFFYSSVYISLNWCIIWIIYFYYNLQTNEISIFSLLVKYGLNFERKFDSTRFENISSIALSNPLGRCNIRTVLNPNPNNNSNSSNNITVNMLSYLFANDISLSFLQIANFSTFIKQYLIVFLHLNAIHWPFD